MRDNVRYANDAYYDADGLIYGVTGDTPLSECTEIRGKIILAGELSTFSDFDNIVSIQGFGDAGVDLPNAGDVVDGVPERFYGCGLIQGFPNLRRIEGKQMEVNSFVEYFEGCYFYDGFAALEFAGDDFSCTGTDSVGSALVEVVGELKCPNDRLQNLERVQQLQLDGAPLPNLFWAGALSMPAEAEGADLVIPMLEVVGEGYEPVGLGQLYPGLGAVGRNVERVDLSSLRRVVGGLGLAGLGSSNTASAWHSGRGQELKEQLFDVEVTGVKRVCRNGPDDPCPEDPACADTYGEGSPWCCELAWPSCLDLMDREGS